MRVRLICRSASSLRTPTSVPGRSCATVKASDVLSSPVRGASSSDTTTKRVLLCLTSWTPAASTSPPLSSAARRVPIAAARGVDTAVATAPEVESAACSRARGSFASRKPRHWASADGCDITTSISWRRVPFAATRHCSMGSTSSALMRTLSAWRRASSVSLTAPSRLFSIGAMPCSTSPRATAETTAPFDARGIRPAPGSKRSAASSPKVPGGPR